jgi:hypothetical protein
MVNWGNEYLFRTSEKTKSKKQTFYQHQRDEDLIDKFLASMTVFFCHPKQLAKDLSDLLNPKYSKKYHLFTQRYYLTASRLAFSHDLKKDILFSFLKPSDKNCITHYRGLPLDEMLQNLTILQPTFTIKPFVATKQYTEKLPCLSDKEYQQQKTTGSCFRCGKQRHLARECKILKPMFNKPGCHKNYNKKQIYEINQDEDKKTKLQGKLAYDITKTKMTTLIIPSFLFF